MQTFDREHSVWARFDVQERRKVDEYCKNYRQFLDTARTERLAAKEILGQAESAGFRSIDSVCKREIRFIGIKRTSPSFWQSSVDILWKAGPGSSALI